MSDVREYERRLRREWRVRHLDSIQREVGRLASESIRIKSIIVPFVLTAVGLAARFMQLDFIGADLVPVLLLAPVLIFWFLDGYVVKQQNLFRELHERVRLRRDNAQVDFNMDVTRAGLDAATAWRKAFWSREQSWYYCTLAIAISFGILAYCQSVPKDAPDVCEGGPGYRMTHGNHPLGPSSRAVPVGAVMPPPQPGGNRLGRDCGGAHAARTGIRR